MNITWIDVKNQKPESNIAVLVYMHNGTYGVAFYVHGTMDWWTAFQRTTDEVFGVTHWMPLPASPHENLITPKSK